VARSARPATERSSGNGSDAASSARPAMVTASAREERESAEGRGRRGQQQRGTLLKRAAEQGSAGSSGRSSSWSLARRCALCSGKNGSENERDTLIGAGEGREAARGAGRGQRQRGMGAVGEQGMGGHGVGTARAEQSSGSTMWPCGTHISGDSKKIRSKPQ